MRTPRAPNDLAVRTLTERPFQVNVFCHQPARPNAVCEAAWLERLRPEFARYARSPLRN